MSGRVMTFCLVVVAVTFGCVVVPEAVARDKKQNGEKNVVFLTTTPVQMPVVSLPSVMVQSNQNRVAANNSNAGVILVPAGPNVVLFTTDLSVKSVNGIAQSAPQTMIWYTLEQKPSGQQSASNGAKAASSKPAGDSPVLDGGVGAEPIQNPSPEVPVQRGVSREEHQQRVTDLQQVLRFWQCRNGHPDEGNKTPPNETPAPPAHGDAPILR